MTELNVLKRDSKASLKGLRVKGQVPGICYGSHFEATSISFDQGEFRKVYRKAGSSSVVKLSGDINESCFIQDMQVHVVNGEILHVDFKIVTEGEKTEVSVPVDIQGEAPAVAKRLGLLSVVLQELELEAIPSEVPSSIVIDVSSLMEVGDSIKVSDLKLSKGVKILEDKDAVIVSISELQEEDEESTGPSLEEVLADPKAEKKDTE